MFILGATWLALHTVLTEHAGAVALSAVVLAHPGASVRRASRLTLEVAAR